MNIRAKQISLNEQLKVPYVSQNAKWSAICKENTMIKLRDKIN